MTNIRASVLHKAGDLQLETRAIEAPSTNEVQVELKATTLCGSDMHYFNHGANGDFKVREPLSLGHESSGIITQVGAGVTDLKVGDRVALEVGVPCGKCALCKKGTLQDRINCPADLCHRLVDNISYEEAALAEPLAVAVHACNRAKVTPGSSVLILGAGAVGLFTAAVAKSCGATSITIADIAENRVKFALQNKFATEGVTLPLKRGTSTEEKLEIARESAGLLTNANGNEEYDFTFECTGVESCVQSGIFATGPGGKLMFVGMGNPIQTLHIGAAALREVDLIGVFRYANAYPIALNLMAGGLIPALDKIITHRVQGLDRVPDAFELAGKPQDKEGNLVIKVAIIY